MTKRGAGTPEVKSAREMPPSPSRSAGALLRLMREAAGVDIMRLAGVLKVPPENIQALEDDRIDALPTITFARGLASAICRAFDTDPAPVLNRMPTAAPALRTPDRHANPPFRRVSDQPAPMVTDGSAKWVLIFATVLLISAVLLWLLPTQPSEDLAAPAPAAAPAPPASTQQAEPMPAGQPLDAASVDLPALTPDDIASSVPASMPEPASAADQATAITNDMLGFVANSDTWVTVRDAYGTMLVNRMLVAGDTVNVGSAPPLAVTIGRKNAVTVTVRGKPFDHKSLTRSEIVRFTVR